MHDYKNTTSHSQLAQEATVSLHFKSSKLELTLVLGYIAHMTPLPKLWSGCREFGGAPLGTDYATGVTPCNGSLVSEEHYSPTDL